MVTYTGMMLSEIKNALPHLKSLGISSHARGTVGLFRNEKDGNAYEIDIRPAKLAQHPDIWGDILVKKIERKNFNPNKSEPLLLPDVLKIIKDNFPNLLSQVKPLKNTKTEFVFKLQFKWDASIMQIRDGIENLKHLSYFSVEDLDSSDPSRPVMVVKYNKL